MIENEIINAVAEIHNEPSELDIDYFGKLAYQSNNWNDFSIKIRLGHNGFTVKNIIKLFNIDESQNNEDLLQEIKSNYFIEKSKYKEKVIERKKEVRTLRAKENIDNITKIALNSSNEQTTMETGGEIEGGESTSHANGGVSFLADGKLVELEGDEFVFPRSVMNSKDEHTITGTAKEVIHYLCDKNGTKKGTVTEIEGGDFVICKKAYRDDQVFDFKDNTVEEIVNEINSCHKCKTTHDSGSGEKKETGGNIDDNLNLAEAEKIIKDFGLNKSEKYKVGTSGFGNSIAQSKGYEFSNISIGDVNIWGITDNDLNDVLTKLKFAGFNIDGVMYPQSTIGPEKISGFTIKSFNHFLNKKEDGGFDSGNLTKTEYRGFFITTVKDDAGDTASFAFLDAFNQKPSFKTFAGHLDMIKRLDGSLENIDSYELMTKRIDNYLANKKEDGGEIETTEFCHTEGTVIPETQLTTGSSSASSEIPQMKFGGKIDLSKKCPIGTKIQSVLFDKNYFTLSQAKKWLEKHEFDNTEAEDEKELTYRFRQIHPSKFTKDGFRTIKLTEGVKAVVGCPVRKMADGGEIELIGDELFKKKINKIETVLPKSIGEGDTSSFQIKYSHKSPNGYVFIMQSRTELPVNRATPKLKRHGVVVERAGHVGQRNIVIPQFLFNSWTKDIYAQGGSVNPEIHNHEGKFYRRQENGKWLEVSEHGLTKKEHEENIKSYPESLPKDEKKVLHNYNKESKNIASKLSDKEYEGHEIGLGEKEEDKLFTRDEIEKKYPYKDYYVADLEVDSFFEGKTRFYLSISEKTGEKDKYGSPIYKEDRKYYQLWNKNNENKNEYKLVPDPYKKNNEMKKGGSVSSTTQEEIESLKIALEYAEDNEVREEILDRIEELENPIKKYKLGQGWKITFDYDGMLKMGSKANISWGEAKLRKLFDSFEDVNYHSESSPLWEALEFIKSGDKEKAEEKLKEFNELCKITLKKNTMSTGGTVPTITHEVTLYSDAKAKSDRFAITDQNGNGLWYGNFFDDDKDYNGDQQSAEISCAKKAIFLASKIKEARNLQSMRLNLFVSFEEIDQKTLNMFAGLSKKHNLELKIQPVPSSLNPAGKLISARGFKKYSSNDLSNIAKLLSNETIGEYMEEEKKEDRTNNNSMKIYNLDTETESGLRKYHELLKPNSPLFIAVEKEFDEWIDSSDPSGEYHDKYFSSDSIYTKEGAIRDGIEQIFEVMKEENLPFIYLNDLRIDLTTSFE